MMLAALVELARRQNLLEDPDFEKRPLHFEIVITGNGDYISLVDRRNEKGRGTEALVPRMPKRAAGVDAAFLVDNSKYVLGVDDPAKPSKPERLKDCLSAFSEKVHAAAALTNDVDLAAVSRFYRQIGQNRAGLLADRPAAEWTGSELLAFRTSGSEDMVHRLPGARAYWASLREADAPSAASGKSGDPAAGQCIVTGRLSAPARLHPALKRVPGGQSSGTSMVSFNSKAFESHGLIQGENAPVCREAAEAYTTALNWLLERDPITDREFRYGVKVAEDAVTVFWTDAGVASMDWLSSFWHEPKPEDVRALLRSPVGGIRVTDFDDKQFYALTLGGNAARAVVRSWHTSTIGAVKTNLGRYFEDLRLGSAERPLAIWQLLAALDPPGRATLPPALGARIYASSITGNPMPREILRHALGRLRVPPERERNASSLLVARVALVKATLRGIARLDSNRKHLEVTVSLDEQNDSISYLLGRLFALLEQIQAAALNDTNATIRDRYFGAASSTPAMVFPRLLKLSVHHESKIGGGLAYLFDERKRSIIRGMSAASLPAHQGLEDQGLFAVGYYHERDWLIEDRKRRSDDNKRRKEDAAEAVPA